jgi:hypothetical protein
MEYVAPHVVHKTAKMRNVLERVQPILLALLVAQLAKSRLEANEAVEESDPIRLLDSGIRVHASPAFSSDL